MSDRLEEALVEVIVRIEAGGAPTADEIRAAYPDCWEAIRDVLELRDRLADVGGLAAVLAKARGAQETKLRVVVDGRYEGFRLLGEGGMGTVYWALDTELNRQVAFKVVRPDAHAVRPDAPAEPIHVAAPSVGTPASQAFERLKARFLQEAWVTAGLEHPGIVPVYEVGQTPEGVPYYTMRFVRGSRTLKQAMDEVRTRPVEERLALLDPFLRVCDTMRYAHAHGVIHRDLKPDNVAIGEFGEVVVLDWGIAKMRGRPDAAAEKWKRRLHEFRETADLQTHARALGTPGYMSPEAATGRVGEIDERSDVYSLGAILFQILTGRLPYEFRTYTELLHAMQNASPPAPASLDSALPPALSAICRRAVSRDRAARPQSVDALATELREWLAKRAHDHEIDVLEREASAAMAAAADLEGDALLRQLDRVHSAATKVLDRAPDSDVATGLVLASEVRRETGFRQRDHATRRRTVRRAAIVGLAAALVGTATAVWVVNEQKLDARALALANASKAAESVDPMRALLLAREAARVRMSPVVVSQLHSALVGSLEQHVFSGHSRSVISAVFSPSDKNPVAGLFVTASADHTARIWKCDDGTSVVLTGHLRALTCAMFAPSGQRVLTGSNDGTVRLFGLDGACLRVLADGPGDAVSTIAYSPSGDRMLIGYADGTVHLRDADGGHVRALSGHADRITVALFSPTGDRIATASKDGDVRVWDAAGEPLPTLRHGTPVLAMAFEPHGALLLTGCADGFHRIWDLAAARPTGELIDEESGPVTSVAYSHAGDRFATGLADGSARVWSAKGGPAIAELRGHTSAVASVTFSRDDELIATAGGSDRTARVFDRQGLSVAVFAGHAGDVYSVQFASDGQRVLSASRDGTARIWGVKGAEVSTSRSLPWGMHAEAVTGINADQLLAVPTTGPAHLRTREGGDLRQFGEATDRLLSARFSKDATRVVTADADGWVRVYEILVMKEAAKFKAHDAGCRADFSPDGKGILTWSEDATAKLWELGSRTPSRVLEGHEGPVVSAAFSGDGFSIVTGSSDRTARIWDARSGDSRATLGPYDDAVRSVAFAHRDAAVLVAAGGTVWICPLDGRLRRPLVHDSTTLVAAFSLDDKIVVVGCKDGSTWLWDAETGVRIARLPGHSTGVVDAEFTTDGTAVCTACGDGNVRVRLLRADDVLDLVKRKISRRFTHAELKQYASLLEPGHEALLAAYDYVEPKLASAVLDVDVLADVDSETSLSEEVRQEARDVLAKCFDDPEYVRERAWQVVREPAGTPALYGDALRWAKIADDLMHESPEVCVVLGVAQHRAGDETSALRTLETIESKFGKSDAWTHRACVAALALVHHAMGHDDKARDEFARLDRLSAALTEPVPFRFRVFLDEARALQRELGPGK